MPDNAKRELLGRLQSWLSLHGKKRKDLPELLGVSMATVNGWFSKNPITAENMVAIEKLIREPKQEPQPVQIQQVLLLDAELLAVVERMAGALGTTAPEVIKKALLEASAKVLKDDGKSES